MSPVFGAAAAAVLGSVPAAASGVALGVCLAVFVAGVVVLGEVPVLAPAPVAVSGFAEAVLAAGFPVPEPLPVPLPVPVLFVLRLATVRTPPSNPS
mgnify:FL=1